MSIIDILRQSAPPDLYLLYFLQEGVAEKELDADPERFLRRIFYTNSGERTAGGAPEMRLAANGLLVDALDEPGASMKCFPDEHLAFYADSFRRTGFRGALNVYRSLHRTWELLAGWVDVPPTVPSLFIVGELDITMGLLGGRESIEAMSRMVPNAEDPVILNGLGHFLQFEAPDKVASLLLDFYGRHHPDRRG
jgi:pimeloyl-ACP methyl ester carboxylesterase